MSPEEQEAKSRKYCAGRILPLESGNVALFDAQLQLVGVYSDPLVLWEDVRTLDWRAASVPKAPTSTAADDLLKELGL